jgi:aryl-alcohol dehydrogenase-like predicted oxidoreductase
MKVKQMFARQSSCWTATKHYKYFKITEENHDETNEIDRSNNHLKAEANSGCSYFNRGDYYRVDSSEARIGNSQDRSATRQTVLQSSGIVSTFYNAAAVLYQYD